MSWPKGKNHHNWGKHLSEATKNKISYSKKGKKLSLEHRKKLSEAKKGKPGIKRTEESKKKHSKAISGHKNHRWKGGRHVATNGYILILKADHPCSHKSGYIPEHRVIAEKHLGRHLKPNETPHHRNGKRNDNRWDNLFVFESKPDHSRYESFLRRRKNA